MGMVYGTMQRHEGEVEVESEPGKGTTMRLLFPIPKTSETGKGIISAEAGITSQPLKILCIDDEPYIREMMKNMLELDGHTVDLADGGQSGIDAFRAAKEGNEQFDVVITDLGMPYVGGREVVRAVKSEMPTTPVILLTGWGTHIKEEADKLEGPDYVLNKPPTVKVMRIALQEVVEKSQ